MWVGTRISLFEHLLDGTVFTRRLTAHEIEDDSLLTLTDLSVLDADIPFAASDGTELDATLSLDHRVIDGAMAAEYLTTVRHNLENPATLLV